jgi:hypothetical protein
MYTLIAHPTPFRVGNLEKDLFTENIKASLQYGIFVLEVVPRQRSVDTFLTEMYS